MFRFKDPANKMIKVIQKEWHSFDFFNLHQYKDLERCIIRVY